MRLHEDAPNRLRKGVAACSGSIHQTMEGLIMNKYLSHMAFTVLLLAHFGLAACNTAEGFGEDVQSTGEAIEDSAEDVKQKM
jgi:predicted small secreted protein